MNAKTAAKTKPHPRMVVHVDETCFHAGRGFRVMIVTEGEAGFRWTGTWPYTGRRGETMPWFWGPTIADARKACREHNARLGIDEQTAYGIVARSMFAQAAEMGRSLR